MNNFKRKGLAALQLVVTMATVAATVFMFLNPTCVEHMLAEVARGVAAGVLIAGVIGLEKISRPVWARQSVTCWFWCWWVIICHEVKAGLLAGYLLGLVMAIWACLS